MNRKDMAGLKKSNKVAIIIMMVLMVEGLVWNIIYLVSLCASGNVDVSYLLVLIVRMVMWLLVAWYGLWGYKKPHGNLLKYLMLIFAASLIPGIAVSSAMVVLIVFPIAILLIGYMAGRLYKFRQNQVISSIVMVEFVIIFIVAIFNPANEIHMLAVQYSKPLIFYRTLDPAFLWLTIWIAYSTRYALHKEAGLQDKAA